MIADTSPLILLASIRRLDFLDVLRLPIIVPDPVRLELRAKGRWDAAYRALRRRKRFEIQRRIEIPSAITERNLGVGESSVLAVALDSPHATALLDDLAARRCAKSLGIPLLGTAGLVLIAKQWGKIENAAPVLDDLVAAGMYLGEKTKRRLLKRVGE